MAKVFAELGIKSIQPGENDSELAEITGYAPAPGVPNDKLVQMARMGVVLTDWMNANHLGWEVHHHND
jgi:hypothetical protein